jgi:hypothetical protein
MSDLMFFSSKLFMIRYQEEEVELNDIGHFRIELPLPSNITTKEQKKDSKMKKET